ncbi:hypothetical protein KAE70_00860 [Bartonella henselae]|nr:hypothetical protein AT239_08045 [Bartonella henselae]OLL54788.1 hypothetical protein AT240_07775 [Bartonella henselae]UJM33651.1 hypothetical protein KAE70_00860 [Bartonella henselae]
MDNFAMIIVLFIANIIMFLCFYVSYKKIQSSTKVLQSSYYTFHILEDSTKEMHFPDGSTVVFNNSDWNFSLDENDNLIIQSALGPSSLSIKAYSNAYGFKKHFVDSLQKCMRSTNQKKSK